MGGGCFAALLKVRLTFFPISRSIAFLWLASDAGSVSVASAAAMPPLF